MMIGIYLLGAFIFSSLLFVNRSKTLNYILISGFIILQVAFTVYEYKHLNTEELGYFICDSLAIIFLAALGIVAILAFYYSYFYFKHSNDIPRERSIYYSAMVVLVAALSAAYM